MRFLPIIIILALLSDRDCFGQNALPVDTPPADALLTEQFKTAIADLDHPDFERREAAADQLFAMGGSALTALSEAAESGSPEVSVRAFEILQRMYRGDDEATFEALEDVLSNLKANDQLAVAARAERAFDNGAETRQKRAISQFERLGGIIQFSDRGVDRQPLARPYIQYIMIGRDWEGGAAGLRLLPRIEDLRLSRSQLYIIRGIEVPEETLLDLMAELPFLEIQRRGPARLGITSESRAVGCVVGAIDPGSAADLAGLKPRDEVTEIDGNEVNSFEGLVEVVGRKEPGDEIPIVFRRGTETHKVVAKLSAWVKPNASRKILPQK